MQARHDASENQDCLKEGSRLKHKFESALLEHQTCLQVKKSQRRTDMLSSATELDGWMVKERQLQFSII